MLSSSTAELSGVLVPMPTFSCEKAGRVIIIIKKPIAAFKKSFCNNIFFIRYMKRCKIGTVVIRLFGFYESTLQQIYY